MMPRYIDADKIAEHKFLNVTHNRYVSDGRPKSEEEMYAYKVGYNNAIDDIAQFAPTADVVERKKGKWKLNKDGNWACPFCGFDPYHDNMKGMNYCPNCGAEMQKETDDAKIH